ncbi:MAG TPA: fatty acid--CoA ligase family protein [Vicinamibacterales bacterium]|nr:fatty acid--CoA ligase family protein [Vicinamibacterales bacterium]
MWRPIHTNPAAHCGLNTLVMTGPITECFDRVSREHRHRVAIYGLTEGLTRTFGDLRDDANALQRAIASLGLPSRPVIVSNVGNRTGLAPLFLASLGLQGSLVLVDGDTAAREVNDLAELYGTNLIVASAGAGVLSRPGGVSPADLPCGLSGSVRHRQEAPAWRRPGETGALCLKITSGSLGVSKAVVVSEHTLLSDGLHVIEAMDIRSTDVNLGVVPMAHSYGMGNLLLPLILAGSPVVLRDRFVPTQWAEDVVRLGVTTFPGVPVMFDYLRRTPDAAARLAELRMVITAGAPIDTETLRHFKERYGVKVHSLYGTSETGSITFDSSAELHEPVSVGWPMPDTAVSLASVPDLAAPEGRVTVQGPAVARRYAFPDPRDDQSSEFTKEGFLTGDVGAFSSDGRLTLTGRVSGFVNVAGRKVHPREVERVIAELAGVGQVWVLGRNDGARGQELVACVERRSPDLTVAEIRRHCVKTLTPYKVPRRIVFADDLPVNARGKTPRLAIEALLDILERGTNGL